MKSLAGRTVLVTGGSGFVGGHLLAALAAAGCGPLHATTLTPPASGSDVTWHELDITERATTLALVAGIAPDLVFHLAAQSHVPTGFSQPELTWAVNLNGTLNLLEGTARANPTATFVNIGSADCYGGSFRAGLAVAEATPFEPLNPYAASKAAADLAARQYAATTGLRVIRARPFNHSGPGQGENFVLPAFAAQIARIEAGVQAPEIAVGDLSGERDFLHIADVVDAYLALAAGAGRIPSGSAFNIASGEAVTIASLLDQLLAESPARIRVVQDPTRLRPVDIPRIAGDNSALRLATDWRPRHTRECLLADLLNHWREQVALEARR
jgi:GDP-4-dehydro-6-deoxy-D-mannose reductase